MLDPAPPKPNASSKHGNGKESPEDQSGNVIPNGRSDESVRTADLPGRTLASSKVSFVPGSIKWNPPTAEYLAKLFPRLEVEELIGRGGMGAVYKARQPALDRYVAIKLLPAEVCQEENFRAKFEREARTLALLSHPRIITAHDFGVTEEQHLYIVMEYVDGTDLHTLLNRGPLTPHAALQVVEDVCEGLAYAHEQGVVHRDVKPANVLIDRHGRAKIVDFGIARLIQPNTVQLGQTTQAVFGTPEYMAPEQFVSASVDHRADIYALGVILYEALCRELPRGTVSPPSTRVNVDKRVDQIFDKARQNAPDQRYQTARHMLSAIQAARAASGLNGSLPNHSGFSRHLPWRRGAHWPWAIATCLIIAAIVAVSLSSRDTSDTSPNASADTKNSRTLALPATPAAPNPQIAVGQWNDWLAQQPTAIPSTLVKEGDYFVPHLPRRQSSLDVTFGPELRNLAARVTYKIARPEPKLALRLFVHGLGEKPGTEVSYGLTPYNDEWLFIRHEPPENPKQLRSIPKPDFDESHDNTLELRADSRLTLLLNGEKVMEHIKYRPKPGRPLIIIGPNISLRKLEWMKLPD